MSERSLLLFGLLILLSVVVLASVLFLLPQREVDGAWQVPERRAPTERPVVPPRVEGQRAPAQPWWLSLPSRPPAVFWMRPFGLHRSGLESIGWYATSFALLLLSSVGLLFLFPQRLKVVSDALRREPRRSLVFFLLGLIGYATLFLLGILMVLNFVTAALVLLLLPLAMLLALVSLIAACLTLGRFVNQWGRLEGSSPLTQMILGVVLVFLLSIIPYIGWVVAGLAAALGFGALLYTRFGTGEEWGIEFLET